VAKDKKPYNQENSKSSNKTPLKNAKGVNFLFDEAFLITPESVKKIGKLTTNKEVEINIVHNELDVYKSPHLMDLSGVRYIERIVPAEKPRATAFKELPGGDILEKLYLFKLLDFDNSEILNGSRSIWSGLKKPFQKVDLTPKLPRLKLKKVFYFDREKLGKWQEVAFVNFLLFLVDGFSSTKKMSQVVQTSWRQAKTTDEVIAFKTATPEEPEIEQVSTMERKTSFALPFQIDVLKPLAIFAGILILLVIPFKIIGYWQDVSDTRGLVLGEAEIGLENLQLAQKMLENFDLSEAKDYFTSANAHFVSAQVQLASIKSFLTTMAETAPTGNSFTTGKNVLELGDNLSAGGEHILNGMGELSEQNDLSLTSKIKNFRLESTLALERLEQAQENTKKINLKYLPEGNREQFAMLQNSLPDFIASMEEGIEMANFAIEFLGDNDLKRYLLVFQNDNELRATGGFMGSFALVDIKSGNLEEVQLPSGGTYDMRAGLYELLQAPKPLQIVNSRWEFQDTNWWPDWEKSAENIAWFYEKSKGPTVDGVIAINSDWMARLLGIVGEIDMPEYNKTITAANFEVEMQKEIEIEREIINQPKKILSDLAPEIIDRVFSIPPEKILSMTKAINDGLDEKDILIYLKDDDLQSFVAENDWNGAIKEADSDYLSVVATNIRGGKSDSVINQEIYHQAKIQADGSIVDNLLIKRSHFGPIDENFTIHQNKSYIRIYVPEGSQLLSAVGFVQPQAEEYKEIEEFLKEDTRLMEENSAVIDEGSQTKIYAESGKTVFANWMITDPGESQEAVLTYKLPFKLNMTKSEPKLGNMDKLRAAFGSEKEQIDYNSYSLLVQKQSGSGNDMVIGSVSYPDNLSLQLTFPITAEKSNGEINFNGNLNKDLFYFSGFKY